jgi:hypothetical protein
MDISSQLSETIIAQALSRFKLDRSQNVISDRISKNEVLKFFEMRRVGFRYIFIPEITDFEYGRLIIIELTKSIHQEISLAIHTLISESLGGISYVSGYGSTDSLIGNMIKNPNGGVYPIDLRPDNINVLAATEDGDAFPNIVWEISCQNQDLIQDLLLWISPSTSVQVAIGIKILDQRSIDKTVRLTAYMYRKNHYKKGILIPQIPAQVQVEFGTDIPHEIVKNLTLSFSESDFYYGTSNISHPNRMIDIPLIELQKIALRKLPLPNN